MTRILLALSIAAILIAAMAAGWLLRLVWDRARRSGDAEVLRARETRARLRAAEASLEAADRRAVALTAEMEAIRADAAQVHASELAEMRAERDAAMETVGALRRRLAEFE